jgi:hypothetical protein
MSSVREGRVPQLYEEILATVSSTLTERIAHRLRANARRTTLKGVGAPTGPRTPPDPNTPFEILRCPVMSSEHHRGELYRFASREQPVKGSGSKPGLAHDLVVRAPVRDVDLAWRA